MWHYRNIHVEINDAVRIEGHLIGKHRVVIVFGNSFDGYLGVHRSFLLVFDPHVREGSEVGVSVVSVGVSREFASGPMPISVHPVQNAAVPTTSISRREGIIIHTYSI